MHAPNDREASRALRGAPFLTIPLLLLAAATLYAQGNAGLNGFQRTGDYLLELDGQTADDAKVYRSQAAQAMLIVASELPSPVLIRPRLRSVEKVNLLKLDERPDGSIDLLPNPTYAAEPAFRVEGLDVVFTVEGRDVRLKPKPPLVGFQPPEEIFAHSPEYEQRAGFYQPTGAAVDWLRAQGRDVRVQIFFGTWCPACGQIVPSIIKIADETRGSKVQFAFYGLEREFSGDSEAKRLGIKSVPTGVVWVNGKEVGRLSGNDWRRPETALQKLLGS